MQMFINGDRTAISNRAAPRRTRTFSMNGHVYYNCWLFLATSTQHTLATTLPVHCDGKLHSILLKQTHSSLALYRSFALIFHRRTEHFSSASQVYVTDVCSVCVYVSISRFVCVCACARVCVCVYRHICQRCIRLLYKLNQTCKHISQDPSLSQAFDFEPK